MNRQAELFNELFNETTLATSIAADASSRNAAAHALIGDDHAALVSLQATTQAVAVLAQLLQLDNDLDN